MFLTESVLTPGKKLSDLERVTSLKVYNWFANRRKEIKRRANIGNVSGWGRGGLWKTDSLI